MMVATAALLLTAAAVGDTQFAQMEAAPCAPGSPGHGRAWCNASGSIAERVDALVNALPISTFPGQLTDMNFGGSLANVSSMGLPKFAFNHEACHGILDCNACGEQGSCAHECPTAPTSFPQVVGLAASFNWTLWSLVGQTISTEARANANIAGSNDPLNFWARKCCNRSLLRVGVTCSPCVCSTYSKNAASLIVRATYRMLWYRSQHEYSPGPKVGPCPG